MTDSLKLPGNVAPPLAKPSRGTPLARWVLVLLAVTFVIVLFKFLHWATELLWFRALGYEAVFWRLRLAEIAMFAIGFIFVFSYLLINLLVLATGPQGLQQISNLGSGSQSWPGRSGTALSQLPTRGLTTLLVLVSAVVAGTFGLAFSSGWDRFLRVVWSQDFGMSDPIYLRDIGFYLFVLPFLNFMQNSLVLLAFMGTLLLSLVYRQLGSLRLATGTDMAADPRALRHLIANTVMLLIAWAWGLYLDRFELLTRSAGAVFGAGYTDIHVLLVGLWVTLGATFVVICVLIWVAVTTSPRLAIWGIGAYLIVTLAALEVIPWTFQSLVVEPNELELETPYLRSNIALTRAAYGLDRIEERFHATEGTLDLAQMRQNQSTIDNIRIWDHRPLSQTFRQLQQIRTYYTFSEVDVDRYRIDGNYRQVMLAARELSPGLPGNSWVNRHLQYTHGYGLAMCFAAERDDQGGPEFIVKDLPPKGPPDLAVSRPEIYYGITTTSYQIVPTDVKEFNYPAGDQNVYTSYSGHGGVLLDRFWKRALFAWHQFDTSLVLSAYFSPQSRIQLWRSVEQSVSRIAPFLKLDHDPYLVVDQGRLFWIQDAYTTAEGFPYSEPAEEGFSYIRNSVKVVIDAYEGDVRFYVVDPMDPVLRTYRAAFPTLFRSLDELPAGLRQHLRYPQDLFEVQVDKFNTYHMTVPQVFYNREDVWVSPKDKFGGAAVEMRPYYVLMKLPGEDRLQFLLMIPVTPNNRDNMIAWIAARSDFPGYGEMIVYKLSKESLILGPLQVEATIDQDTTIARQLTLWDQRGSRVVRGNLLVIPINQSFLYVEPVFLIAEGTNIPQLKRVIVGDGIRLAMEPTLTDALRVVFGERPSTPEVAPEPPQAPRSSAVEVLSRADQALRRGDWTAFGHAWEELKRLLAK